MGARIAAWMALVADERCSLNSLDGLRARPLLLDSSKSGKRSGCCGTGCGALWVKDNARGDRILGVHKSIRGISKSPSVAQWNGRPQARTNPRAKEMLMDLNALHAAAPS